MEIVWTEAADRDVALAFDYLQARSVRAARTLLRRVFDAVDDLGRMPRMGKVCELGLSREYRELVVGYYKVFYAIDAERNRIIIARVWDTRQDPARLSLPRI